MLENNKLKAVYNGSDIIINAGFTMQSNYILPVLSRMKGEGLINDAGATVVQAIFSFKHTEEMPYPTRETIALYLGKTVDYVKKALKSIKEIGILTIVKSGRKSKYDFKPFFALLEKFIVEYKQNKNHKVKIADLMKVKVEKKEAKDFSWSEEYKDAEKEVVPVEEVEEVQEEVTPVLSEEVAKVVEVYGIDAEGIKAVEKAYTAYSGKLQDAVFIEKIIASADKKGFVNYFNKCITTAYTNNEQPKQAPTPVPASKSTRKTVRKEMLPNWLDKNGDVIKPEKPAQKQELTQEEFEAEKKALFDRINKYKQSRNEGVN